MFLFVLLAWLTILAAAVVHEVVMWRASTRWSAHRRALRTLRKMHE